MTTPQTFGSSNPTATVAPQPQTTGLSFGLQQSTPAPTSSVQPLSSIAFSTPSQPGISFGQQTTQSVAAPPSTSTLSFGLSSTPNAQKPATGLTLNQPSQTPATGFSFGQPSTTTAASAPAPLSFGLQTSTSAAAPSLSLNPLTTSTTSTGLSFGQPSTQAPPLFGASQPSNLLGSLGGQSLMQSTTAAAPTIASAPQVVGLGGIDINTTQPKATEGKNESTKVKEAQVPKEIIQTVEDFKAYVKLQKTLSSDIIRVTDRKLKSVVDEIKRLNCNLQEVSNKVDNNKLAIKLLRSDTSKIIQHADMAQRELLK